MASGDNFMASPLVLWVETFLPEGSPSLKPNDLYDGVFLSDVLQQIDPRPSHQNVNREVEDDHIRLQNWDLLIKNIRAYYTDVLQQLIVTKMPNIQTICHQADKDASFDELKKVILLILGCAVQCERKERFIENIKLLDLDVQHAIVEHIKEVTDDSETVLHIDPPEQLEEYTEKMFSHVTRLIKERDDYAEVISDLIQERDYYHSQAEGQTTVVSTSPEKHHLAVELAEFKAKLRHARQELEDKSEQLTDLREEIDTNKETISKLRAENLDLVQDARSARTYRDELDVYKEKASKVDKYESEITKYKEKLDQLEFFKSRVDELRADNAILVDTKTMLTEQLTSSHKRVETVIELENELIKYRQQIQHFSTQRDSDRETIQELTEEIARLEFAKKNSMDESATLEQELEDAKKMVSGKGGTLSEQMQETANTKILRLELENQRLQQKVDEMKEKALIENSAINLELEKENQRLAKKVEKLQETSSSKVQEVLEFEAKERQLTEEKNTLVQTIETVKENSERQVKELEQENMHLNETLQTLRERNEKTNDLRIREIEKENKRLHESVNSLTSQNSTLDFENRQLQKSYDRLKESADKISVIEHENDSLEKENNDLYQEVATLRLSVEKYRSLEEENSDLDVDNRKLCKTVEHLQLELNKKEKLEQENINLTVETERLKRAHELLKNSSDSTIQDLEKEKEDLSTELQHVKKMFEAHKIERAKYEQMELDLLDIDGEKHKIIKSLESTSRRVQQLEQDNNDLELENEKLQKTVENLKLSVKKLEQVERENSELDQRVSDISKHKSNLEKENKKIKQTLELKESELDEILIKSSSLEQEVKSLRKVADQSKDVGSRVKELEKENKDFFQQMSMEKKTVSSLREDLLNEKLRTQQLTNELETLNHELEHIGIDRDKLAIAQTSKNENRYKALESIMEETLSKNMEIKEEKIRSLESRLEEFRSRYQKQQLELRAVTRECDVLKQRCEEETLVKAETTSPGSRPIPPPKPGNPNRDFLKLKDHLVDVERSNATLIAENKSLKSHNDSLNQQLHRMESQSSSVQSHVMSLQGQTNSIQTENAKLQVENTTLQSQCASFMSQVTGLQNQFTSLESDHERLINSHEQLQSAHEQLASDHETLQRLHERLTQEYEHLVAKHGAVKSQLKSAKDEVKDLQDQAYGHSQEKNNVNKQRSSLEREREQLKLEQKSLGNLQMDYNRLRDDHDHLKNTHENLNRDFGDVLTELKNTKSEYNTLQVHHTELQGSFADCREQIHALQVDIVKLEDKCESYSQINTRLDEDNRGLMLQVQTLLNQNQELLTQALESKDHLGETEKAYLEKLADLRRQKEKLEEKIMEQYKMGRWDMSPRKKGGIGSTLVRKAKGLITRAHRSRSRPNLNESPDSSSVGSYGENTDDGNKKSYADRRKSAGYLNDSSNLASMNKSLAKSTTALNYEPNSFRDGRSTSVGEDEGGFVGTSSSHVNGKASPGSKMMSLEEFLRESNGSPETRRKEQDSDSRDGSDSMERGGRSRSQPPPQPRRRAPQPPPNEYPSNPRGQIVLSPPPISQDHLPTPRGRNVSSPPPISQDDLPTPRGRSVSSTPPVPQDHPTTPRGRNVSSPPPLSYDQTDLNMSRMSRISASSMGSSSEDRQEMYNNNIFSNKTSTPKMNNEESQVAYERRRFNNRPGSAVNDPSRRQSTNIERASANANSSSHDPTYASANNLHNRQPPQSQYNRSQSKSPAPDYSTWNGRERAMSPPRSSRSPGPAQQLFTNNLGSRNTQNYSSPNRPASALPFHGRRTPVERERPPYPGQMSSQGTPQKPKSYTPQPVSRIASAANINRERSPQANRPSGDYIHKPSPSYPPNYTPVTSQRISNGAGDNNMGRQLPSTPSSGGNYGAPPSGRMTPTAKPPMQRQLVPESSPNNHSYSPNNHGYPSNTNQNSYSNQPVLRGDQRQVTQATNQGGPPVPTPRQSHPSSRYADVSQNSPAHTQNVSKGLNGPEGQRPLQSRTQQPVVLASRLSYPANGRGPTNLTPMARIQPQTKLNNNNLSAPPSKSSSSPEGSEPKGPKENSVWPRAHRV